MKLTGCCLQENGAWQADRKWRCAVRWSGGAGEPSAERTVWRCQLQWVRGMPSQSDTGVLFTSLAFTCLIHPLVTTCPPHVPDQLEEVSGLKNVEHAGYLSLYPSSAANGRILQQRRDDSSRHQQTRRQTQLYPLAHREGEGNAPDSLGLPGCSQLSVTHLSDLPVCRCPNWSMP